MKACRSPLLLAVLCAVCVSTAAGCGAIKKMDGAKWIQSGRLKTYTQTTSTECMRKYCIPNYKCKAITFVPRTGNKGTCVTHTDHIGYASFRAKSQVWYCPTRNGGGSSNVAGDGGPSGLSGSGKRVVSGRKPSAPRLAFKAQCTKLVTARLDPIVNKGQVSGHVHNVFGNQNFGRTVSTRDFASSAQTTCNFRDDRSMYWSPALYGKLPGNKWFLIPSFMNVYYETTGREQNLYAMPKGLRMVVGNANKKSGRRYWNGGKDSISANPNWLCHYHGGLDNTAYGTFPGSKSSRGRDCTMWQGRMYYPDCWNGRDLDSRDHISHMRYSVKGICPLGYRYQIPQLKMETIFRLTPYKKALGRQPRPSDLVLSNGDKTGASFHADVVSGWDENFMARQLKNCNNSSGSGCNLSATKNRVVKEESLRLKYSMPSENAKIPQPSWMRNRMR